MVIVNLARWNFLDPSLSVEDGPEVDVILEGGGDFHPSVTVSDNRPLTDHVTEFVSGVCHNGDTIPRVFISSSPTK